ncbi:MAG: hypothetical protein R6X19_00420 [Kiritimatiellia bacterium]
MAACLACLLAVTRAPAETHLSDWAAFDTFVESRYEALAETALVFPPDETARFGASLSFCSFDSAAFPELTNTPPQTLAGVPAWTLRVIETQDAARIWRTLAAGISIHTNAVPAYDPAAWARTVYGEPPEWLAGDDLARWYRERTRERIELNMTLIPADRCAEYLANLALAATNGLPPELAGPVLPADTNCVAFARVAIDSPPGFFAFDLYTPGDLRVDIFSKTSLSGNPLWRYAGTVQAVAPFTPVAVPAAPPTFFLHAARGDMDSDGDVIPDGMETLHFGTSPFLWDSSGGGLSDWRKIYQYGLDPLLRDTDADGFDDDEELLAGTNPAEYTPGAGATVRYYYDDDGRVAGVYAGSAGGAANASATPAGNPASLRERSAP